MRLPFFFVPNAAFEFSVTGDGPCFDGFYLFEAQVFANLQIAGAFFAVFDEVFLPVAGAALREHARHHHAETIDFAHEHLCGESIGTQIKNHIVLGYRRCQ